jgi:hypothetical protein
MANRAGKHQKRKPFGDVSTPRDRCESVYHWKDEAEQEAKAALGGKSAAAAETDRLIRHLERTPGRKSLEIEYPKKSRGE